MKIYNYGKIPEGIGYRYGYICELADYDLEPLKDFDEVYYWYAQGSYEGIGELIGLLKGKWYMHNMGHCSCYGPLEHLDISDKNAYDSLEELKNSCSMGLMPEVVPLIEMAMRNNGLESNGMDKGIETHNTEMTKHIVEKENAFLRELLTNFVEINRSTPEVKWIALDDLAKVIESALKDKDEKEKS